MATGKVTPPPGFELEGNVTPPAGFELETAAPQGTPPPPENVIRPAEGGAKSFLENLQSDIEQGTGITTLGKLLRKAGATGTRLGVSGDTGAIVGGPLEGVPRALHGFLLTQQARTGQPSEFARGANEILQGAGQVGAPIAGVTNPAFLPMAAGFGIAQRAGEKTASAIGAGPDTSQLVGNLAGLGALGVSPKVAAMENPIGIRTRASSSFANVESKIGDQPINHQPVLNTAYKAMEMSAKGFQLPKAVSDFVEWAKAVQASRTPFKFADARDFYTALGESIPWEQYGGKGGRMYNQVMKMRSQLGDALQSTANQGGMGAEYQKALKDYRSASQTVKGAKTVGSALTLGPAGKAVGLSGGDLAAWLARKVVNAGAEVPGSAAGSLVKSVTGPDIEAIRQTGESTRRSNAQFIQDVIRRQGLPVDPMLKDVQAQLQQRAAAFQQQREALGPLGLESQQTFNPSPNPADIPPVTPYYERYGQVAGPAAAPNTAAATAQHMNALDMAKARLGPNASLSQILQEAAKIQNPGQR